MTPQWCTWPVTMMTTGRRSRTWQHAELAITWPSIPRKPQSSLWINSRTKAANTRPIIQYDYNWDWRGACLQLYIPLRPHLWGSLLVLQYLQFGYKSAAVPVLPGKAKESPVVSSDPGERLLWHCWQHPDRLHDSVLVQLLCIWQERPLTGDETLQHITHVPFSAMTSCAHGVCGEFTAIPEIPLTPTVFLPQHHHHAEFPSRAPTRSSLAHSVVHPLAHRYIINFTSSV